jgi:hypothetical protein
MGKGMGHEEQKMGAKLLATHAGIRHESRKWILGFDGRPVVCLKALIPRSISHAPVWLLAYVPHLLTCSPDNGSVHKYICTIKP